MLFFREFRPTDGQQLACHLFHPCTEEIPHQEGTREAGKDKLDSLESTREAPERQEGTSWTA